MGSRNIFELFVNNYFLFTYLSLFRNDSKYLTPVFKIIYPPSYLNSPLFSF